MFFSSNSLPKPKNWQDFETQIRELFACVLNDPNTQKNGRSGQEQNGVDVYGYRTEHCLVGVQCKQKLEKQVTDEELLAEVNKAKNFKPKISEFFLVTTAPRDQKIQETARQITRDLAQTDHPIRVVVWGWEDIEEHATQYKDAWKAFDPTFNPFAEAGFDRVTLDMQEIKQTLDLLVERTSPSSYTTDGKHLNESEEDSHFMVKSLHSSA
jgi:hypothetical protein